MKKLTTLSLITATILGLTACGGGSSSSSNANTGHVGDGYIQGAYVCHDSNNDMNCLDETYATTLADGSFTLSNYSSTLDLLVQVPIGAVDNGPFVDTTLATGSTRTVNAPVLFILPAGSSSVFASPFSTLIYSIMQENSSLTLSQAEDLLKARLGLTGSSVSLFDDYLSGVNQNSILHTYAEVITSALLENMGDLPNTMSDEEKLWYATQFIYQNIGNMISSLPSPIPNNFDPSNHDSSIRFSSNQVEFDSQVQHIGAKNKIVNIDACSTLTNGIFAFEHWNVNNGINTHPLPVHTLTDTAYLDSSEIKIMKLDSNNKIHLKSEEYPSAGTTPNIAWDSRVPSSSPEGYVVDINNLNTPATAFLNMPLFNATKTNCLNNKSSFTNYSGLLMYNLYLTATDISGSNIVDNYSDFANEINIANSNIPITFPNGSQQISIQVEFTKDAYVIEEDNTDTQIIDAGGTDMDTTNWSVVASSGETFYFVDGNTYKLEIFVGNGVDSGIATLTNLGDNSTTNGTWELKGTGGNTYLQTNIDIENDGSSLFISSVTLPSTASTLRHGTYHPLGKTLNLGNPFEDIMDDIVFNKTARDAIMTAIDNGDADGDLIINSLDNDNDGDGVLDVNDAFPLDNTETIDTDNDGIGDNTDTDDDGDGVLDVNDAFPLDNTESIDTDGDTIGNNADTDDDNDGLSDADEITNGTNPLDTDSDNDGLSDDDEVNVYSTNPTVIDTDGDGVSDGYEVNFTSTNPTVDDLVDSDGDGLDDQVEVVLGTSSTDTTNGSADANLDSDGDGISNYVEVYGINNNFYTNPLMVDTDGDFLSDYAETTPYQSNPMTKDTDNDGSNDNVDNSPLNPNQQ